MLKVNTLVISDNNPLIIIGDVHGKVNQYKKILDNKVGCNSIQLGDFGFKDSHDWLLSNIDISNHKVLFGNHDYYPFLDKSYSLGDYSVIIYNDKIILCIRGAYSIDKFLRKEELDWFSNEELSYLDFNNLLDLVNIIKPDIIISHDCPLSIKQNLFNIEEKSITSNGLEAVFDVYKPKLWIFGHYHKSIQTIKYGTVFKCLSELEVLDLNFFLNSSLI